MRGAATAGADATSAAAVCVDFTASCMQARSSDEIDATAARAEAPTAATQCASASIPVNVVRVSRRRFLGLGIEGAPEELAPSRKDVMIHGRMTLENNA